MSIRYINEITGVLKFEEWAYCIVNIIQRMYMQLNEQHVKRYSIKSVQHFERTGTYQ